MLQQLAKSGEADRKKKLDDDEIEQLLCEDDDQPEVNLTQQTGKLKRKNISPPNSPVFRKRKYSSAPNEKWLLESKDEKSEHCGRSKELGQLHQSLKPNAGEVKLSAGLDSSSEQVRDSKTDIVNSIHLIRLGAARSPSSCIKVWVQMRTRSSPFLESIVWKSS